MYYPSSENKGADQLRGYRDLRLCFRLCRLLVFPCGGSFILCCITANKPNMREQIFDIKNIIIVLYIPCLGHML